MTKKIILVPDIHGRDFWKDLVPFADECDRIIFLGDYHDPYDYEGITPLQSLSNFKEIIEFAKQHPDKITLLLGNHDLTYYATEKTPVWDVYANRHDWENHAELRSMFKENRDMFDIVTIADMVDINRKFLFSHAGIHPLWITENSLISNFGDNTSAEEICDNIGNMFQAEDKNFLTALRCIGVYRGGMNRVGSMVWADCCEYLFVSHTPYTQVFGHTQQLITGKPYITGTNVCLDSRQCFYIDEEGSIHNLNTDEIVY